MHLGKAKQISDGNEWKLIQGVDLNPASRDTVIVPFRKWSPALCILTIYNYFCGLLVVEELDKLGIGRFSVAFIYSAFAKSLSQR